MYIQYKSGFDIFSIVNCEGSTIGTRLPTVEELETAEYKINISIRVARQALEEAQASLDLANRISYDRFWTRFIEQATGGLISTMIMGTIIYWLLRM